MIILFLKLIICKNNFGNKSYVVSVWAGKETIRTRVISQAKTWFRSWNEVIVYSDKFYKGTCEHVQSEAYPCKVKCVTLGDYAHHLEGTEWTHRWYFAQPRFLPAMAKSYENDPNADFYIFVDDDTFLLKQSIVRKFEQREPSEPKAAGVKYCTWDRLSADIKPERQCHPFLQGGAGVILSHGLLSKVASELVNCSKRFNDPDFAGSMRFAVCMERIFGIKNWSEGEYIDPWPEGLHSSPPKIEIPDGIAKESPASFHRMNNSDFYWLAEKIYIPWKANNIHYRADLGLLPFIVFDLPFIKMQYTLKWCVGMWVEFPFEKNQVKPKKKWSVLLDQRNEPIGYEQEYANGLTMRLICDNSIPKGEIVPFDISGKNNVFIYRTYPLDVYILSI